MKIKITKGGIYGVDGEIAIGTVLTVKEEPTDWVGRYEIISGLTEGKTAVTNPAAGGVPGDLDREALKAQADELGIEYARNVTTEKLKELVDAKLAE
ncbi:hypothetical protein FHS21_001331 [Phyllobacterium trifolii]|uniref:Uncharacterized protein n=1 Tax=Phyllobacterium trifolii TaxID=300193 RepID=A0A839U7F3_9HYPH|nr:hypothetical protein [Phyllobacterium trifolii]MBB3144930.1 hypothetical protein [Phyllobacterium trifolii]